MQAFQAPKVSLKNEKQKQNQICNYVVYEVWSFALNPYLHTL